MGFLFTPSYFQPLSSTGALISGAQLFFYRSGTTTLVTVYQDANQNTPHTNPVVADAAGRFAPIFVSGDVPIKVVLKDASGVTIQTVDPAFAKNGPTNFDTVAEILADETLSYSSGAFIVAAGDIIEAQGFRYEVAASGATDQHLTTQGGVKLYVLADGEGRISVAAFGVIPDGSTNWEVDHASRMTAIYTLSAQPGICIVWPGGNDTYATSMNLTSDYDGSRMHFEGANFGGILHLISGITNVKWTGDVGSYDRLGLQACTNTSLPETIRMLSDPAENIANPGVGNRGIHFQTCSNIEWGEIIVDDTGPTQATAPGTQQIWAAFAIQSQGLSGFKGRVHVKNASGHGVYINALDIDIDLQVGGYGKSAIDYNDAVAFLEGTNSAAQSEQGCGVWLNRVTGRVSLEVDQSNASPAADVYAILVDETGVSSVPTSRDQPLIVTKLVATVGNGNRGVCIGESLAPSPTANVIFESSPIITLRSANTIESGFGGFNIIKPSADAASYRRAVGTGPVEFVDFGAVTQFLAQSDSTASFTEVAFPRIQTDNMAAGRLVHLDGSAGGTLRGRIGDIVAVYEAGSSTLPVVDIDNCTNFILEGGDMTSISAVATTAIRINGGTNLQVAMPRIYNFGRSGSGAVGIHDVSRSIIGPFDLGRSGTAAQSGLHFSGAISNTLFQGIIAVNFLDGIGVTGTPTFIRCNAIQCIMTGNTDDTDLTLAMFPAANQFGCTNWSA